MFFLNQEELQHVEQCEKKLNKGSFYLEKVPVKKCLDITWALHKSVYPGTFENSLSKSV